MVHWVLSFLLHRFRRERERLKDCLHGRKIRSRSVKTKKKWFAHNFFQGSDANARKTLKNTCPYPPRTCCAQFAPAKNWSLYSFRVRPFPFAFWCSEGLRFDSSWVLRISFLFFPRSWQDEKTFFFITTSSKSIIFHILLNCWKEWEYVY